MVILPLDPISPSPPPVITSWTEEQEIASVGVKRCALNLTYVGSLSPPRSLWGRGCNLLCKQTSKPGEITLFKVTLYLA